MEAVWGAPRLQAAWCARSRCGGLVPRSRQHPRTETQLRTQAQTALALRHTPGSRAAERTHRAGKVMPDSAALNTHNRPTNRAEPG